MNDACMLLNDSLITLAWSLGFKDWSEFHFLLNAFFYSFSDFNSILFLIQRWIIFWSLWYHLGFYWMLTRFLFCYHLAFVSCALDVISLSFGYEFMYIGLSFGFPFMFNGFYFWVCISFSLSFYWVIILISFSFDSGIH